MDNGIVDGYGHDGSASPFLNATRAQVLKILLNAADVFEGRLVLSDPALYNDVNSSLGEDCAAIPRRYA